MFLAASFAYYKFAGENEAEAGGEKQPHAGKEPEVVYPLEPFVVNINEKEDIRYLKVKVEFGIKSEKAKEMLEARKAPLRDAILVLLTTKTYADVQELSGKSKLRDEILAAANRIIPEGGVAKVYFTDFVIQ